VAIGFQVGMNYYPIGSGDFLYSFFSTVAFNLEHKKWGKKYPYIMKELYQGTLKSTHINSAIKELSDIQEKLSAHSPDDIVWDIEDLKKQPPWGKNIADTITTLANYFITCDGEDFINVFERALIDAKENQTDLIIQ